MAWRYSDPIEPAEEPVVLEIYRIGFRIGFRV